MGDQITSTPLPLMVLQCSGCRSIVGDTSEFVCVANLNNTKFVVIRATTDINVDRIAQSTTLETGESLSHFSLCCSCCGNVVGRMYTAALPPPLQIIQDSFALEVGKCSSYQVGSADIRVQGQPTTTNNINNHQTYQQQQGATATGEQQQPSTTQPMPTTTTPIGAVNGGGGAYSNQQYAIEQAARIETLETELLKMQHIILLHDTQLQQLPGYQSLPGNGGSAADGGGTANGNYTGQQQQKHHLQYSAPPLPITHN